MNDHNSNCINELDGMACVLPYTLPAMQKPPKGGEMKAIKLIDSETIETRNVFNFADGPVTVIEREVHELYGFGHPEPTRLIIVDVIERAKDLISRSRSEIAGLREIMRELSSAK